MSAIAGIFRFDGAGVDAGQIEAMTAVMALRGPDGSATWRDANIALGHCMLRTTAESLEEIQPWADEERSLLLVMDGRIDNYETLRKDLLGRGVLLRNRSDAELVLRAYALWGSDCLKQLKGDFALAIWDARRQQVFCARDRMGNKPLHYFWNGSVLAIASTVDALLALPFIPKAINSGFLAESLIQEFTGNDETLWDGLLRLPAAHCLHVAPGRLTLTRYWLPDVDAAIRYGRDEEYQQHYRELLADVIRSKARSHRPLACEVSGGLDSSAVFSMAKHLERQGRLAAPGITGYGLVFHDDQAANEVRYIRAVGDWWQQPIVEVAPELRPPQWYAALATRWRDCPGYPNGIISLGLYQRAAAAGSRVLLTGWAGDDWLSGSRAYYADLLQERQWRQWLRCFATDCRQAGIATACHWMIARGLLPLLPFAVRSRLRRWATPAKHYGVDQLALLAPPLRELVRERRKRLELTAPQHVGRVGQRAQLNKLADTHFQHCHEYSERLAAEQGLELINPLHDERIVQFAFSTPEHVRISGLLDRACHRAALTGILPDLIVQRRDKADFMGPFLYHLPAMRELLLDQIPGRHPDWVSREGVASVYALVGQPRYTGVAEWMLWSLFGCDAVYAGTPVTIRG